MAIGQDPTPGAVKWVMGVFFPSVNLHAPVLFTTHLMRILLALCRKAGTKRTLVSHHHGFYYNATRGVI